MKVNRFTHFQLCALGWCLLAQLPGLAIAHPEADVSGRIRGGSSGDTGPVQNTAPSGAPAAPVTATRPGTEPAGTAGIAPPRPPGNVAPRSSKLSFQDQIRYGYQGHTQFTGGQVSHEHAQNDLKAYEIRFPLEIWYVATVKWPEKRGVPFYCVAPRVENPSESEWSRPFLLELGRLDGNNIVSLFSKTVGTVPAGGSMEVFSHCKQTAMPPSWVIETPHGEVTVNFPRSAVAPGNRPANDRR